MASWDCYREDRRRRERCDTSERRIPLSLSVRYLAKTTRTTAPTRSNRGFIAPSWQAGLSTFLCPAEIHAARKCLLKISTSVIVPLPPPSSSPCLSVLLFHRSPWSIFPLDSGLPARWSRLIRALPHNLALIKPIRNYRNWDAINYSQEFTTLQNKLSSIKTFAMSTFVIKADSRSEQRGSY